MHLNRGSIVWLAARDYLHEWRMSVCFILALAAVLGPMLALFGLKFGIVTSMVERLVEDPRKREIRPVGSGHYTPAWFEELRARSDVAFVMPRTRTISATLHLYRRDAARGRILPVELIPSAVHDPLLGSSVYPDGFDQIVLSDSAARKLDVRVGETIEGSLSRTFHGKRERARLTLTVTAVSELSLFPRDGAFVSLPLLKAVESYRDGRSVPALGWKGDEDVESDHLRSFPGYRLYAGSIGDVAGLRDFLASQGLNVRTSAAEVELVQSIDRNLSLIFWVIACVGLSGYVLSLGASLWANVDRKRRELSVLRLVGFSTRDIIRFPVWQALFTAFFGWLLAGLIYGGVAYGVNDLFSASLADGMAICRLLPRHLISAGLLTAAMAVLASSLGGLKAASVEPSDGLRET